jgi:hypothetical protein
LQPSSASAAAIVSSSIVLKVIRRG